MKASIVLLESIRKYEYNWSAWAELAMLVKTQKQFDDIRALLNRCMGTSIIKEFFLAKLCIDLHQPTSLFREIMGPLTEYFPNSPYVTSQWAKMFYENMGMLGIMELRIFLLITFIVRLCCISIIFRGSKRISPSSSGRYGHLFKFTLLTRI